MVIFGGLLLHPLAKVNSIIATAICECSGERAETKIAPEQAKQMAKCIITALAGAGLEIHYTTYSQTYNQMSLRRKRITAANLEQFLTGKF